MRYVITLIFCLTTPLLLAVPVYAPYDDMPRQSISYNASPRSSSKNPYYTGWRYGRRRATWADKKKQAVLRTGQKECVSCKKTRQ